MVSQTSFEIGEKRVGHNIWKNDIALGHNINWLESDMEQWTGSKLGKEDVKAVYCHPAYLNSMQSTSCEMSGWMKLKLASRLLGEINILRYVDDTTLIAEVKRN